MKRYLLYILTICLIAMILAAVNMGPLSLSFTDLLNKPITDPLWHIWLNVRLPRVLLAVLIGIALATSGIVMQAVFRNPLADAGLLGISSGAALFVGLFILFPFHLPAYFKPYGQIIAGFVGGSAVCGIIYLLSHSKTHSITKLLLAGIAINALTGSLTGVISYLADDQELRQLSLWTMGHLGKGQWEYVIISALFIIPSCLIIICMSHLLNILQLGDEDAHYLGINVQKTKRILLLLSALLIGTAVSISGIIAFVGLAVPHMLRLQIGADHRLLVPATVLGGGCLLLFADTLARVVAAPNEIPVGLITSLIGGPYFMWLILRKKASL